MLPRIPAAGSLALTTLTAAIMMAPPPGISGPVSGSAAQAPGEPRPPASASIDTLPAATLETLDGDRVDLRSTIEGPAVINLWATWCGPCRREMPELARLHRELAPAGLQTVGIAISSGSSEEIRSFAEQRGVDYLLLRASREWARRHFRMLGMPTTLIVDADGRIRERLVGPQSAERLRRAVEPLLPG